jgi:serine/threonine protein kinase
MCLSSSPSSEVIYDADEIDGAYYITMPMIEGESLAAWMRGRTGDPPEAAKLVSKLARALDAVPAEGIVHRDIKPSNVMIDRSGEPLLMDFGLARQSAGDRSTRTARPPQDSRAVLIHESIPTDSDSHSRSTLFENHRVTQCGSQHLVL